MHKLWILSLNVSVLILLASTAGARELSFAEALNEIIDKNADVHVQQSLLRASESKVSAARGLFSPQFSLSAANTNFGGVQSAGSYFSGASTYDTLTAQASWNVFRSGADVAALDSAKNARESQAASLEDAVLRAEDKAAQALLTLIESKLAVEAYKKSELSSQHFLEIAEKRYAKSLQSREELDRVATDASNAEAKRADAEVVYNTAKQAVESLLGSSDVQIKWPLDANLKSATVEDLLKQVPSDAKQLRPDLKAARLNWTAQDYQSRQLWRGMLPTIDLQIQEFETLANGMLSNGQGGWLGLATLTIPLWSGLHDYSAYRVQIETRNAAEYQMRQLERDIDSIARLAQDNYRLAFDQYARRKKNLERAQHILQQDEARFRLGRSDANELNLDLARVTEAEILTVQGIQQVHSSYVALYHAFGRRIPETP